MLHRDGRQRQRPAADRGQKCGNQFQGKTGLLHRDGGKVENYLKPAEIKHALSDIGLVKSERSFVKTVLLSLLAGVFISFASYFATVVLTGEVHWYGIKKFMSGAVFATGLILVMIPGAELFTGNNLMIISVLDKKIKYTDMLKNWAVVYAGNFLGALFTVLMIVYGAGLVTGQLTETAVKIAADKAALSATQAFFRGIGANWLVCLAVMMTVSSRDIAGKILGMFFPVAAFVAMGFEHSIANMYFLPAGFSAMHLPANSALLSDYVNVLTVKNMLGNIFWVTLGNIIGGGFFVGVIYWYINKAVKDNAVLEMYEEIKSRNNRI